MNHREIWHGEYKGIRFEINRYMQIGYRQEPCWTFYLHLYAEQFPESVREKVMTKTYFTQFGTKIETYNGPLNGLEWHGGLTWSSNETKPKSVFTCLKFGYDYQHLWDENKNYSLEYVEAEMKECIESLFKLFPEIKTTEQLWEEWRKKFPGKDTDHRWFDRNGQPVEFSYD